MPALCATRRGAGIYHIVADPDAQPISTNLNRETLDRFVHAPNIVQTAQQNAQTTRSTIGVREEFPDSRLTHVGGYINPQFRRIGHVAHDTRKHGVVFRTQFTLHGHLSPTVCRSNRPSATPPCSSERCRSRGGAAKTLPFLTDGL